ncbi:hypothetical protein BU16DRAFT_621116 [Lophium mytilinum]|uniref:DUF7907 domain-containing protein n=1 Tax=Lophium mytilinum TaxID=390894 RepID=A0A6A6QH89_9PEZI|nr:hypothetical protein BU16DRAFT_621116 [Lophium mytilinum]
MKFSLFALIQLSLLALAHPNRLNEPIHRPRAAASSNSTSAVSTSGIILSTGTSFPTSVILSTGISIPTSIILSTGPTPSNTTTSTPPFANTTFFESYATTTTSSSSFSSSSSSSLTSSTPSPSPTAPGPVSFKLRTALRPTSPSNPSPPHHLANLYLTTFHTGAGTSDPVFAASSSTTFYLNNTSSGGGYGGGTAETVLQVANPAGYIWGFQFTFWPYTGWGDVTLDVSKEAAGGWVVAVVEMGGGSEMEAGRVREEVVVRYEGSGTGVGGGWLVCDWWHAVPQLFFRDPYRDPKFYPAPKSCAEVELVMEFVGDGDITVGG